VPRVAVAFGSSRTERAAPSGRASRYVAAAEKRRQATRSNPSRKKSSPQHTVSIKQVPLLQSSGQCPPQASVHSGRRAKFCSRRRPFLRRPAPEIENKIGDVHFFVRAFRGKAPNQFSIQKSCFSVRTSIFPSIKAGVPNAFSPRGKSPILLYAPPSSRICITPSISSA